MTTSEMVHSEEIIAVGLFQHYLAVGWNPGEALERLASALALSPPMFTRMVGVMDILREEYVVAA